MTTSISEVESGLSFFMNDYDVSLLFPNILKLFTSYLVLYYDKLTATNQHCLPTRIELLSWVEMGRKRTENNAICNFIYKI
jgi:hypothetical protein